MPKTKQERTCVNCKKKTAKSGMFRIVRTPEGSVSFDRTGNAAGRGAYVCSRGCFSQALENGKLARSLRVKLTKEVSRIGREIESADTVKVV